MKKQCFFENAKLLNKKFGIIPLMYGSLGLEYITSENLNADDIDILIPEVFVTERWEELKSFLKIRGYILIDEYEHSFEKNGIAYSYASIEELKSFAGIEISDIVERRDSGIKFRLLSLEQYLKVYRASAKDGYRITVREKKDNDKIAFIEKKLNLCSMNNYNSEVSRRFGETNAYKEYEQKSANYSNDKFQEVNDGLMDIFEKFANCKQKGNTADSIDTQALVIELQNYITDNYYTCTNEILAGLGQMYIADERFKTNIDKNGIGTAEFVSKAIEIYCK